MELPRRKHTTLRTRRKINTKYHVTNYSHRKPRNGTDNLVRPEQRKDLRFGTWSARRLFRARSLTAEARELARYKLDLVGVQEVRWDKWGTVRAGD